MEVVFSADQAAADLWTHGEDHLVDPSLDLAQDQMRKIWKIAGRIYLTEDLPVQQRVSLSHVIALAMVEFFEGEIRPLAQDRRRASTRMPQRLRDAPSVDPGVVVR